MLPITYNIRSLLARRTTSLMVAAGIGIFIFIITLVQMLHAGVDSVVSATGRVDNVIIRGKGAQNEMTSSIPDAMIPQLRALPGIEDQLFIEEFSVIKLFNRFRGEGGGSVMVRGVPASVLAFRPEVRIVAGRAIRPGSDEVMVGARLPGRFEHLSLGDSFKIGNKGGATVVGVFEARGTAFESEIWGDVNVMRKKFGRDGIISTVRARLASDRPETFSRLRAALAQSGLPLVAARERDFNAGQSAKPKQIIAALGTIVGILVALGATIATASMIYSTVALRAKEISLLKTLGFTRGAILASFLLESILLSLAGTVLGFLACLAMGSVKLSMLNINSWSQIVIGFHPTLQIMLTSVCLAILTGVAGGLFPALRAARQTH